MQHKKLAVGIAALGLGLGSVVGMSTASASGNPANDICKQYDDFAPFFSNHGACVQYFNGINGRDLNQFCKDTGNLWGFAPNQGQCMQIIKQFI